MLRTMTGLTSGSTPKYAPNHNTGPTTNAHRNGGPGKGGSNNAKSTPITHDMMPRRVHAGFPPLTSVYLCLDLRRNLAVAQRRHPAIVHAAERYTVACRQYSR